MKTILVFVLFVIKYPALGNPIKQHPPNFIVGGVEAVPHSIPYQAAIILNSRFFCGGVLISTKYVLTVAHCTYKMESIEVILGAHNIFNDEDSQIILYNPTIINHANYIEGQYNYDISLIKLNKYITSTSAIKAIGSLAANSSEDFVGRSAVLSGWGLTSHDDSLQSKLRKVHLEIISNKRCIFKTHIRNHISEQQMCTLGTDRLVGPVGACVGDSGSPLVTQSKLVGLVSFGHSICDAGLPTVYTRISYFREWIQKHSGVY